MRSGELVTVLQNALASLGVLLRPEHVVDSMAGYPSIVNVVGKSSRFERVLVLVSGVMHLLYVSPE